MSFLFHVFGISGQLHSLQYDNHQLKTWLEIVKKNFSDTVHSLKTELKTEREEQISLRLAKITLGQEKAILENEIKLFKKKCQDDIIRSLEGIPEITRAFREKIDTLFPHLIPFHITCEKQHEQLEQIRYNCSSLSVQVENKFQPYLNDLVNKVSEIIRRISHFQAKAFTLERSMDECKKNLSSQEEKYYNNLRDTVIKNERQEEKHLLNIKKLTDTKEVLDRTLRLRESEINMLKEKINTTCGHRVSDIKHDLHKFAQKIYIYWQQHIFYYFVFPECLHSHHLLSLGVIHTQEELEPNYLVVTVLFQFSQDQE